MGGQAIEVSGGITKETFGRFIGMGVIGPESNSSRYSGGQSQEVDILHQVQGRRLITYSITTKE